MRSRMYLALMTVLITVVGIPVWAELPNAIVYIPFNSDWNAVTSNGDDVASYSVLNNRAPYSVDGSWGNAICFDRTTDYSSGTIYYQDGGSICNLLDNGFEKFTICGWFKADRVMLNGDSLLLRLGIGGVGNEGYLRLVSDNYGRLRLVVNGQSESDLHWFATQGEWTFFAVTYDGSVSTNNVLWYRGSESVSAFLQAGDINTVGSLNGGALVASDQSFVVGNGFYGSIDEVRFYNTILTSEQIEEVRVLARSPEPTGLQLYKPVPEPLFYMPFDDKWDNSGSAGVDTVTHFGNYDEPNDIYNFGPKFAPGVRGKCLDFSFRKSQTVREEGGTVRYGQNDDPNSPMKKALNGLRSFTICGWFKVDGARLGNGSHPFFFQRRNNQLYQYKLAIWTDTSARPKLLVNHTSGPWTPYQYWGIDPGTWVFRAVTYNVDAFGQEEAWYQSNSINQTAAFGTYRSHSANILEDSAEPIIICPAFDGYVDELYLFGSKTDGSGALSLDQLKYVAAKLHQGFVCGTEGYLVPEGDVNSDCIVNVADLEGMANNWLIGVLP